MTTFMIKYRLMLSLIIFLWDDKQDKKKNSATQNVVEFFTLFANLCFFLVDCRLITGNISYSYATCKEREVERSHGFVFRVLKP